jgi:hypothetical protein
MCRRVLEVGTSHIIERWERSIPIIVIINNTFSMSETVLYEGGSMYQAILKVVMLLWYLFVSQFTAWVRPGMSTPDEVLFAIRNRSNSV